MAMASRYERGLLDPDAPAGLEPVRPHHLVHRLRRRPRGGHQRGGQLARGHQRLGNLVVLYDDNHISIEGDTQTAFSEDVMGRYAAYGWHVQRVEDGNDVEQLHAALTAAQAETDRPSFIAMRTIIGYPAPNLQNTGKAHGAALGKDEVALTKEAIGFPTDTTSTRPTRSSRTPARSSTGAGPPAPSGRSPTTTGPRPTPSARRCTTGCGPPAAGRLDQRAAGLRGRPEGRRHPQGQRQGARGARRVIPELWGGSADLAESNTPPSTSPPPSCPRATRCRAPTRTAGPCTSASASTPWAPS
jgi:transketolase